MTSLLNKIPQGGWVPFAISAFFLVVMLSWTHGRSKKTENESENKMSIQELDQMLSSNIMHRARGTCFFFTDLVNGIPPIIRLYIQHTNSVREVMVIVTIRTLPIKTVLPEERLNVGKMGNEGVYRCLVQFGYNDSQEMEGVEYVAFVIAKLQELVDDSDEIRMLESAARDEVVFAVGRTILKTNRDCGILARLTIDHIYRFLQKNSRSAISTLGTPPEKTLQVGMLYEI